MHKVDSAGATLTNTFTDGNPATATPATVVGAKWLNAVQAEIIEVIAQAGIVLDDTVNTQLYEAIMVLVGASIPTVPDASETVKGKVELATNTEASTGTDTQRAVTPAGVAGAISARVASATARGIIEIATSAETITGTDTDRAVTPAGLAALTTTETRSGLIELATAGEAAAGTDAVRAITPATLAAVLAAFDPVPVGLVLPYAGTAATVPTKYLLAYGQAVSRTTYAALFAKTGVAFGAGDGSTTFNLPDVRGRGIAGVDNMGGSAANRITNAAVGLDGTVLGAAGGSQTHTLTLAEIPAHQHAQDASTVRIGAADNFFGSQTNTAQRGGTTAMAGGGQAHAILQPTIMMNMIIKAL